MYRTCLDIRIVFIFSLQNLHIPKTFAQYCRLEKKHHIFGDIVLKFKRGFVQYCDLDPLCF